MERHCSRFSCNCQFKSVQFSFNNLQDFNMSWKKESAQVGLAGLNPLEAVRGGGDVSASFSGHAWPSQPSTS